MMNQSEILNLMQQDAQHSFDMIEKRAAKTELLILNLLTMTDRSLTKENFFNEIETLYPLAFADFGFYIDYYKAAVNWDELFNAQAEPVPMIILKGVVENWMKDKKENSTVLQIDPDAKSTVTSWASIAAPKFHEIHLLMQLGIIMDWINSIHVRTGIVFTPVDLLADGWNEAGIRLNLTRIFNCLESRLYV